MEGDARQAVLPGGVTKWGQRDLNLRPHGRDPASHRLSPCGVSDQHFTTNTRKSIIIYIEFYSKNLKLMLPGQLSLEEFISPRQPADADRLASRHRNAPRSAGRPPIRFRPPEGPGRRRFFDAPGPARPHARSEEHTSELQSRPHL